MDHQSSSKNPVVSKNWHSNYRGSTVFCFDFSKKIWQMIHMKCQAIFLEKNIKIYFRMSSAAVVTVFLTLKY